MFARAETLENTYLQVGGGPLALTGGQLWLRQSDRVLTPQGVDIIHAHAVQLHGKRLVANEVSVFRLDERDRLLNWVEATQATLELGAWHLQNARVIQPEHMPEAPIAMKLPTDLTVQRVEESFASPDTLSFWALPGFHRSAGSFGFLVDPPSTALPDVAGVAAADRTMALVSAGFSMRPARRGGVAKMIGSGIAAGFVLFMVSKMAEEFGQSGALPVELAAWAPTASGLMLAVALLLHTEDG